MGINISNKSYRDDFLRVINDLELKGDEFEVRESFCSTAVIPPNVGFTKQEVTVRYMPSGVEKEYNAGGHFKNWVDDFRKDWEEGFFEKTTV